MTVLVTNIGIILGSTRPNRVSTQVAQWVYDIALSRSDAKYELVDIADFDLPLLDEAIPASMGQYEHAHTRAWAAQIANLDGFIFVTPEYNQSVPGSLKNAIDFLYAEWNNKAAGFVTYGSAGGARAADTLRTICGELQIADVRGQVLMSLTEDFENYSKFTPREHHEGSLNTLLDQVNSWSIAMERVRTAAAA